MRWRNYPLAALLRLRRQAEREEAAALGRALRAVERAAEALAARRAEGEARRSRLAAPPARGPDVAALAADARHRAGLREALLQLAATVAAQADRLAEAGAALERSRAAHARARAERRAVELHRERWLAGRRAAFEAAEERERDDRPAR